MKKRNLLQYLEMIEEPNREKCLQFFKYHEGIIRVSPGSKVKHQAWPGGYVDHLEETMWIAENNYRWMNKARPLPFTLGDVIFILFWHDVEKPFKYVLENKDLNSDEAKWNFLLAQLKEYEISLSENHMNALKYIHGEGDEHNPTTRIQGKLAAFCHGCDNASARGWPNYPLPKDR